MSSNVTGIANATVYYTHHIHRLDANNYSEENTSAAANSVAQYYADGYQSSSPGGCFTTPYYHIVYSQTTSSVQTFHSSERPDCGHFGGSDYHCEGTNYYCSFCGYDTNGGPFTHDHVVETTTNYNYWTTNASDHPSNRIATVYLKSCGKSQGEITDVRLHYN